MSDTAIKVENLSKVYKLYDDPVDRLREAFHPLRKKYHHDFYALRNISFEIQKGETVGIIGKNGAGKSTLLKILTGVLTPSTGMYTVHGKVSSILELGAGFNPELTGLENVYFNGAILGYSKQEMDSKIDNILDFADIGEFIYQPVKIYSSGMQIRLAFAIAINIDPDVLIIDEALAVGDIRFQQKCLRKIKKLQEKKKTILFVSHDSGAIVNYCTRAIWLREGQILEIGKPESICKKYITYMSYDAETTEGIKSAVIDEAVAQDKGRIEWEDTARCSSFGEGGAVIKRAALYSQRSGKKVRALKGGESVSFYMEIEFHRDIFHPIVGLIVHDSYGNSVTGLNNSILDLKIGPFKKRQTKTIEFQFDFPFLKNGQYSFSLAIAEGTQDNHIQHHWVHDAYIMEVVNKDRAANIGHYFILKDPQIKVINS